MKSIFLVVLMVMISPLAQSFNLFLSEEDANERNQAFDLQIEEFALNVPMGTDIVGNGGGLVEGLLATYYRRLPTMIRSAIEQELISFTEEELEIMFAISALAAAPDSNPQFVLVDESRAAFFHAPEDVTPRLAKTGFSPDYPIFWNAPLLEEKLVNPEDMRSVLLGSMIHEVGHQARVLSHRVLDDVAGKIVASLGVSREVLTKHLRFNNEVLQIEVLNFAHDSAESEVNVIWGDRFVHVRGLDSLYLGHVCQGHGTPQGYRIRGLQWQSERTLRLPEPDRTEVALATAHVSCMDDVGVESIFSESARLEVAVSRTDDTLRGSFNLLRGNATFGIPPGGFDFAVEEDAE